MANLILVHPDFENKIDLIKSVCKDMAAVEKMDLIRTVIDDKRYDEMSSSQMGRIRNSCAGGMLIIFCHCCFDSKHSLYFISEDGQESIVNGIIKTSHMAEIIVRTGCRRVLLCGCKTGYGNDVKKSVAERIRIIINTGRVPAQKLYIYGFNETIASSSAPNFMVDFLCSKPRSPWLPYSRGATISRFW